MQKSRVLILLWLAVTAAAARPADRAGFEAFIDRARAVPAEFAADALIRLAASDQAKPEQKLALLEEAFRRAAGAQQPLKKRSGTAARTGSAAFLDRAFAQDLDANTLQCRAVRAMLPLDRKKARELFRDIPRPQLKRLTCDDGLVFDVSAYYETLGELANSAFTPAEVAEDEPFKLVNGYVQGLQSAVEAVPVARLLTGASLKPPQLGALVMAFSAALKDLAGDDRSFSFTVSRAGRIGQQVAALAARCARLDISATPLLEGYRAYLVRHLGAARCADGADQAMAFGRAAEPDEELAQDPVRYFNEKLRNEAVKAIAPDEAVPSKLEGAAGGLRSCEGQACQQVAQLYRGLILGPDGLPYGADKKAGSEWQGKVKEYLAALAEWKDDPVSTTAEYFQDKCRYYSDLFNLLSNGPDRVAALRAFLDFLKLNSFQRESRIEWFLPVNSLVARVSLDPLGLGDLLRDLRNAEDPVISLYAALEQTVPRPPGSRLSIM